MNIELKVELVNMILDEFRGSVFAQYEFGKLKNKIVGENGAGKTRLMIAESWLRNGQDTDGNSKFPIKKIENGKKSKDSKHSVSAKYFVNGECHELFRSYYEKEKNGNVTQNTTEYRYNKKKIGMRAYSDKILEIFGENYRLCTEMRFFANMKWKDRRDKVFNMITGKIDEKAIAESLPGFIDMAGEFSMIHNFHDLSWEISKEAVKEIAKIKIQIEERQDIINEAAGNDSKDEAQKTVMDAENELKKAKAAIANFQAGDRSKITEQLKSLRSKLFDAENKLNADKDVSQKKFDAWTKSFNDLKSILEHQKFTLNDYIEERERLVEQWKAIKSRTVDSHPCDKYDDFCPYFGIDVRPEIIAKHQENLNKKKSIDLEINIEKGQDLKAEIVEITQKIEKHERMLKELKNEKPETLTIKETKEIKGLKAQIETLQNQPQSEDIPPEFLTTLANCEENYKQALRKSAAISTTDTSQQRIEELTEEAKKWTTKNLKASEYIDLYNQYTKKIAKAVEGPVNAMFKKTKIKMFERLENGKLVECCELTDLQGRPYDGSLSTGEKIEICLDYLSTFQKKFGISGPVFIDDINLYTGDIPLNCQTIELWAKKGSPLIQEI